MNLDLNQRGSHEGHNYHYTYPMSPKFLVDVILCAHDIIYEKIIPKCCDWCMILKCSSLIGDSNIPLYTQT